MKSKPTKITRMDKQDSYGNYSFIIEMATGEKGFYTTKESEQKKFVIGQEAEFNIEKKTGKSGKDYFKITLPQVEGQQGKSWGGKQQPDEKVRMISFAAAYCKDLICAGKVAMKDFAVTFDIIYNEMSSKLPQ